MATKEQGLREIEDLASRLRKATFSHFDEWDTIIGFLVPMLQALGWNIPNGVGEEIHFHGYADRSNVGKGLPDCVLYANNRAYAAFEVKSLSYGSLDKESVQPDLRKLQGYCSDLGCSLQVFTRMYETNIYDHQGKLLLRIAGPSEYVQKFDQLWDLLSKEKASLETPLHSAKERR